MTPDFHFGFGVSYRINTFNREHLIALADKGPKALLAGLSQRLIIRPALFDLSGARCLSAWTLGLERWGGGGP